VIALKLSRKEDPVTTTPLRQQLQSTPVPKKEMRNAQQISATNGLVEMMDITPDFAAELLVRRHPHQRPLKEHYVLDLARAMHEGRWRWTADAIRLDKDLFVIDGQHRLSAVVKSGLTMKDALVATVTSEDVILSIDQNRPRTLGDMRAARGQTNLPRTISGAIIAETCDWSQWRGMPRELQLRTIEECPFVSDLEALVRGKARQHMAATLTVGSLSGALRCIRTNREDAMKFFDAVFSMNPVIDGKSADMVRVLYSYLSESKAESFSSESRTIEHAHKCVNAYNHWKSGRTVSHLQWKGGMPPRVVG
jgi:hypothetical protein